MEGAALARKTDLAFLKIERSAGVDALRAAVELAKSAGFRSLCVPPVLAGTVKKHNPTLRVCAALSYPLGQDSIASKIFAAQELIEQQVDELDIVLDLFALLSGNLRKTELEASRLLEMTRPANVMFKAIIETSILDNEQIRAVSELLAGIGVDCIKTSTGYHRPPTSLEHVELIRQVVGTRCLIKASGGIRSSYEARTMLEAGADILGVSNGAMLLEIEPQPVGA